MAAWVLPLVLLRANSSLSETEKNTSTVLTSDTVVNAWPDALTNAPALKGRLPTTPAAGLFTLHHANCSRAEARAASAWAT